MALILVLISCVCPTYDGTLLASKASDNTVRIWRTDSWRMVAEVADPDDYPWTKLAFHPISHRIATLGEGCQSLRIWDLDVGRLLSEARVAGAIDYTSAKIILVGESNVGKSCLAMRLAEDRYPEDHEHETTHGMQFWPMEAEDLHSSAKPPEG